MRSRTCVAIVLLTALLVNGTTHNSAAWAESPTASTVVTTSAVKWFEQNQDDFLTLYRWLHQHPELSFEEEKTAAKLAAIWKELGFEMTTGVGGHGIVGVMHNGNGPVVMIRTDLDALPVTEQTPVPFASTVQATREDGSSTGVMHACGHDIHMTNVTTVGRYMSEHRDQWSGTLMMIGQPAEELGEGAKAMLGDGLFERFPKPDYAIAIHVSADKPTGAISVTPGYSLANVDSVDITVKGRGGHGSAPHSTIDPIVQAADLVLSLQMIVSREVKPIEPAVVTVGSIHGGTKHNVIGNECKLQLTVRSYSEEVRQQVLAAIRRRALAVALAHNAEEPDVLISQGTPSLRNDDELTSRMTKLFADVLGEDKMIPGEQSMGGEDFSRYGIAGVPILMYSVGSVSQNRLDRFEQLGIPAPSLHSGVYYPDAPETLKTAFATMTASLLDLMKP
ncbi:amidohydrolase family protein [Rhodopirellula maiorica SM1]|uniref:Amidohydrolase family protein n=1 Tax=Rhodopirellula maiorica SM1 TaxID=1265738 RepID=M5RCV9_9BACT|nr:amidohydrolase [Rhodopirellula maiorica]EMI16901.1 amidohydrolase family protein [Rhodopirellula maiorica SM1]